VDPIKIKVAISEATKTIREKVAYKPDIGLVLGSGLGYLADEVSEKVSFSYKELPHFPRPTVEGHAGQLVFGTLAGKNVMIMQGRFHHYEGYSLSDITFPIRLMASLGVKILVVTNAAGGINHHFETGDLMLISDHINLLGDNPLRGPNLSEFGSRFPDMTQAYCHALRCQANKAAIEKGIHLRAGVYAGVMGPSYETPAEIRFLKTIGADAVGMSTVPEVIVAVHSGLKVMGISCITNMAAGLSHFKLEHQEVINAARNAQDRLITVIKGFIYSVHI
jgi:purine-nucleoside phosphorylase